MSDKINMSVDIAGVTLKNPITVASGTFGSGMEYSEFVDLSQLGAGQSYTSYSGDIRRNDECHRTSEPRNRCVQEEGYSIPQRL